MSRYIEKKLVTCITGFLLYNAYHDNKYSKMLMQYKKYYQMAFIGFLALSLYLMIKSNPLRSKNMLLYANNFIKYMPIDKSSIDMLTPILDLSSKGNKPFMDGFYSDREYDPVANAQQQKSLLSGNKVFKRSVSETKKKYVASIQDWKCAQCNNRLNHTFEIDHKIRLEHGGTNDTNNLVALCRECHGQKTAMENM